MPSSPPSKSSARKVLLAAAATLVVGAALVVLGSGMPPVDERSPYASALVAVELARTPAEVEAALGPPASGAARDVLERVVQIDFVFLVAYPLLSLAIAWYLTRGRAARGIAAALALAMASGDALENLALFGIFEEVTAARLASLALWTTVKWAALFASAALIAALLWARGGAGRALAAVPAIAAVVGAVGLAAPAQRRLVEIAGITGMGATWLIVVAMAAVTVGARRR